MPENFLACESDRIRFYLLSGDGIKPDCEKRARGLTAAQQVIKVQRF
jgi:hypothetical protein